MCEVEDTVESRERILKGAGAFCEHGEGFEKHEDIDEEHHEVADGKLAVDDLPATVEHESAGGGGDEHLPDAFEDSGPPPDGDFLPAEEVVVGHDAGGFAAFAVEGAEDTDTAEGLGPLGINLFTTFANIFVAGADVSVPCAMCEIDRGGQNDATQEKSVVDDGKNDDAAQELDNRAPGVVDHGEDKFSDTASIFAQEAGDASGFKILNAVKGEPDGLFKGLLADRQPDTQGGPGREPASRKSDKNIDHGDGEHPAADQEEELPATSGFAQKTRPDV